MNICPFPGYENHLLSYLREDNEELQKRRAAQGKAIVSYELPDGMTMENRVIPGGDGQDMNIRVYTPEGLPENAPMVMEIHGGAFVGGNLDIDNSRCIAIASRVPCIVVGVEYRLCNDKIHFPKPLEDVHAAFVWMQEHAAELGGDAKRIGLHGSSAGGTLCAGLALYLRDSARRWPISSSVSSSWAPRTRQSARRRPTSAVTTGQIPPTMLSRCSATTSAGWAHTSSFARSTTPCVTVLLTMHSD